MKSVYSFCLQLWSEELVRPLKSELSEIMLLSIPNDLVQLKTADRSKTIVTHNNNSVFSCLQILKMGFGHCLDADQADFGREVLAASLMLINSKVLTESNTPFFLRGLNAESSIAHSSTTISITKKSEIVSALSDLIMFLKSTQVANVLPDVATFTADELLTNALHAHKKAGLENTPVHLYAGVDNNSFVIGCTDSAGSLDRDKMLDKLLVEFSSEKIAVGNDSHGAGLGLRLVLDGASSLYIHSVPKQKTIFCLGFKLMNIKSNLNSSKHLHFTNLSP